jgi:hypothetical protein
MRFLVLLLALIMVPAFAFARMEGGMERYRLTGFYGYGSLPAGDVNNYINSQVTTPKWNNLSNALSYGAEFGYMLNQRFELQFNYEQQWAKNSVNTTVPPVTNGGVELYMNSVWAGLNMFLVEHGPFHLSVGALAGYPIYAHTTVISSTWQQYDSAFTPMGQVQAKIAIMLSRFLSIDLEGGYQYALLGAISQGGGTTGNLKNSGANVNMDFSGWRGKGGLSFHF